MYDILVLKILRYHLYYHFSFGMSTGELEKEEIYELEKEEIYGDAFFPMLSSEQDKLLRFWR